MYFKLELSILEYIVFQSTKAKKHPSILKLLVITILLKLPENQLNILKKLSVIDRDNLAMAEITYQLFVYMCSLFIYVCQLFVCMCQLSVCMRQ